MGGQGPAAGDAGLESPAEFVSEVFEHQGGAQGPEGQKEDEGKDSRSEIQGPGAPAESRAQSAYPVGGGGPCDADGDEEFEHRLFYGPRFFGSPVHSLAYRFPYPGYRNHPHRPHLLNIGEHHRTHRFGVAECAARSQGDVLHDAFEGMPHRQHAQPAVAGIHRDALGNMVNLVEEVTVGEHYALGFPGGSRGEDDGGGIFGTAQVDLGFDFPKIGLPAPVRELLITVDSESPPG